VDLGVPSFLLSSALNIVIAQRLVLRLCPTCKQAITASPEIEKFINETVAGFPEKLRSTITYAPPYKIALQGKDASCKTCKGRGVVGRVALYEMFRMTRELGELINKGFTEGSLWDEARRQGILTMRQDGILKVLEGVVSAEEVLKETAQ
jgi:type II secretory ATPase GspE/PulE/Tfp pilus assembly ATPase PilB-like protein